MNTDVSKRLFLLANYRPDDQWSMRIYADLVQEAAETGGWQVTRLEPKDRLARGRKTGAGRAKFLGYIDKYLLAPLDFRRALRRARSRGESPDLVHITDHSNAMYAGLFPSVPVIVTCHDVIAIRRARGEFPLGRPGFTGRLQQKWILASLRRVAHFIFVSDASRKDLARLTSRPLDEEPVIFPPLGQKFEPIDPDEAARRLEEIGLALSKPFLLHHGNSSWYKNREQVLETFGDVSRLHPDLQLVFSGGDLTPEQSQWVKARGLQDRVHAVGAVSRKVLEALYSRAAVFFFPSWVEGFGWPPVEAQACGCPVVASRAGSLAEVLGDSARAAEPDDREAFVRHIGEILSNSEVAADLRRRGFLNAARYAQGSFAQACLQRYAEVKGRTFRKWPRSSKTA